MVVPLTAGKRFRGTLQSLPKRDPRSWLHFTGSFVEQNGDVFVSRPYWMLIVYSPLPGARRCWILSESSVAPHDVSQAQIQTVVFCAVPLSPLQQALVTSRFIT